MGGRFRGFLERYLGSRQRIDGAQLATDRDLLHRFAAYNDQDAFELLVRRHGAMILGLCNRQLRDEHLAEDAFQAVFLILARKASSIRGGNVAGWLYRVARRVTARAAQSRIEFQGLADTPIEQAVNSLEQDELARVLDEVIARLPQRLQDPILLCYLAGRSTEEAARELGCPRGTVLSRLSTARKRLADQLGRRGVTLPAALTVLGVELRGRLVCETVTAAPVFLRRLSLRKPASLLAEGVLTTMKNAHHANILGLVVAVGLIGGIGWGIAGSQPGAGGILPPVQARPKQGQKAEKPEDLGEPLFKVGEGVMPMGMPGIGQDPPGWNDAPATEKLLADFILDPVLMDAMKPHAKDSLLRRLQRERCYARAVYLAKISKLIEIGKWNPLDFDQVIPVPELLARDLLELLPKPEDKLKCYQFRVQFSKLMEYFTAVRIMIGSDPERNYYITKAARVDAEIDLLRYKGLAGQ